MTAPAPGFRFVSADRRVREDRRFVAGKGRFAADVAFPGTRHVALLACPYPAARIGAMAIGLLAMSLASLAQDPLILGVMQRSFWAVVALEWILPFFILLSEKTKRNRTILLRVAVAVLIGHWLDLYVSIVPAHAPAPRLTGWELALALGTFAAVGWAVTKREREEQPVVAIEAWGMRPGA